MMVNQDKHTLENRSLDEKLETIIKKEKRSLDEKLETMNKEEKFQADLKEIVSGNLRRHIDAVCELETNGRILYDKENEEYTSLNVKLNDHWWFSMYMMDLIYSDSGNLDDFHGDDWVKLAGENTHEDVYNHLGFGRAIDIIYCWYSDGVESRMDIDELYDFFNEQNLDSSNILHKIEERINNIYDTLL